MDLVVPERKITALRGESGCGESMVAAALTGTLPTSAACTGGQVRIDGVPVDGRRERHALRGRSGRVARRRNRARGVDDLMSSDGAAVLPITDDVPMPIVTRAADRVVVMGGGKVTGAGTISEAVARPDPYGRGFFHPNGS